MHRGRFGCCGWIVGSRSAEAREQSHARAPAVIVAASLTYDVDKECPHTFALKKETPRSDGHGFNKGLWAVSARTSG